MLTVGGWGGEQLRELEPWLQLCMTQAECIHAPGENTQSMRPKHAARGPPPRRVISCFHAHFPPFNEHFWASSRSCDDNSHNRRLTGAKATAARLYSGLTNVHREGQHQRLYGVGWGGGATCSNSQRAPEEMKTSILTQRRIPFTSPLGHSPAPVAPAALLRPDPQTTPPTCSGGTLTS